MTEVTLIRPIMRWKRSTALLVAMMLVLSLSFPMLALAVPTTTQWRVVYWDEGTILWGGYVADGSNATPPSDPVKTGYTFVGWSNDGTNITADRNIYAIWEIDTFTVNYYDEQGGNLVDSQTIDYGADSTPPGDPTKPGHTFTGWSGTATNVTSDVDIYANWDINYYNVYYYDDIEGTLIDTQNIAYGSNATPPSDPVREGYDFTGWSNDGTNIADDTYIYATWERSQYTVSYYDGENFLSSQNVFYGENAVTPENPSKEGYTFTGWDNDGTVITGDRDIYATWDINYYTVNYYDVVEGTLVDSQQVAYGDNAISPSDPSRLGYTFTGWSNDGTNITGDTSIYGEWTQDLYTVSFYSEGELLQSYVYYYGTPATPPSDPTRTGYTFAGWSDESSFVTGDMDINALWDINYYTVNYYDGERGELVSTQQVAYGSDAIVPDAPNNVGFALTGWSSDGTNITGDTDIYANWTADWNAVVFTNEGSIVDYQAVPNGAPAVAPEDPTKEGYTFTGWYTSGGMPFGAEAPVFADVIYQATWEINTFTIRYCDDVDGNVIESQIVNWMDNAVAPADPTREGYTFAGWSNDGVGITADIDICATWEINTFTVNYYDDVEGNLIDSQVVNWMDNAAAPADPTREGYTFAGWSADGVEITADTNIYATWEINYYDVNYYDDVEGTLISNQSVAYGSNAVVPADPTREGYTFTGWSADGQNITGATDIYATWEINTFTVNYYDDVEGNLIDSQTVNWMDNAVAPADPTRTGYTFTGWSSNGVEITENTNINATWEINYYDVKYYDGVEGSLLSSQSIAYGGNAVVPANPSKSGYVFTGWSADGKNIAGATTIVATWRAISTDATLSNISSQWGKWDNHFTPADGSYRLNLSTSKNSTRVVATKSSHYAQVYVSFDGINWKQGSTATVIVARGTSTRLYFKVIAESGAEKIYKLKFVRAE